MIKWAQRAIANGQRCSKCGYEKSEHIIRYLKHTPDGTKIVCTIACAECADIIMQEESSAYLVE